MAVPDHLLRFRQKSTADLLTLQAALEAQETVFVQQAMGTKSFTRDLHLLQDKLNAIAFVLRERGSSAIIKPQLNPNIGITDFGNIQ